MAIKGGRKIVVLGREFHWVLSGKGDSSWGEAPVTPHVIIQGNAGLMTAFLESRRYISEDAHDLDIGGAVHTASVTPNDVRILIETALNSGWDPDSKIRYTAASGIYLSDYTTLDP